MARLTMAKPALPLARPKIAGAPATEAERLRERDKTVGWRKLYHSARWRRLRLEVFERDGLVCQQTGQLLIGKHPAPDSPVADHIRPHRGDETLFFDPANVQTVSKEWHDSRKQSLERRAR